MTISCIYDFYCPLKYYELLFLKSVYTYETFTTIHVCSLIIRECYDFSHRGNFRVPTSVQVVAAYSKLFHLMDKDVSHCLRKKHENGMGKEKKKTVKMRKQ
jgi:hypothetical protein